MDVEPRQVGPVDVVLRDEGEREREREERKKWLVRTHQLRTHKTYDFRRRDGFATFDI